MDAEAFKKEFLPYHQKMYRVAYRFVQDVSSAEDLVQEAFIKLWNKRNEIDSINNTEAYAIIILRNACLDHLRKTKHEFDTEYDYNIPESKSLEKEIELKDEADRVRNLIKKLPDQQRQIMEMKHWDGYSDEEIEEITGLSAGNIRVILSRARKTIREQHIKAEQRWT